jgi:hypothetical protein
MERVRPKNKGGRPAIYKFATMAIGDAFVAPVESNLRMCAYKYGKKHRLRFKVNKTADGLRCERVA